MPPDQVWRQLDPTLWELTQNPGVDLQTASREKLQGVLVDPASRKNVDDLVQVTRDEAQASAWFLQTYRRSEPELIKSKSTRRSSVCCSGAVSQ